LFFYKKVKIIIHSVSIFSLLRISLSPKLHNNQIKEIRGLEYLTKLKELYLDDNPIKEEEEHLARKVLRCL